MFKALFIHSSPCLEFFPFTLFPGSFFRPNLDNTAYRKPPRLSSFGSPSSASFTKLYTVSPLRIVNIGTRAASRGRGALVYRHNLSHPKLVCQHYSGDPIS